MDPDSFTASLFKWDPRGGMVTAGPAAVGPAAPLARGYNNPPYSSSSSSSWWGEQLGGLEELFQAYGIRYYTAAKIAELGFTARTLVNMRDEELDEMMTSLSHIFRWDLLVGERYGVKAAVRAERRRLDVDLLYFDGTDDSSRRRAVDNPTNVIDALSQEGLSEEPVQQEKLEMAGSGGGGERKKSKQQRRSSKQGGAHMRRMVMLDHHNNHNNMMMLEENDAVAEDIQADEDEEENDLVFKGKQSGGMNMGCSSERQREHPFIVTEPGEVARGKKNGLDYLFHLYEQCREFLVQVQAIAKERGEKCPTKVTNEVFRFAKKAGASHINKPKMRHYVHCYALHCLDEGGSNTLRRAYKERGENVGSWRQACYKPLVAIAAHQAAWDIDSIFNAHPRLSIWYVPTKLRQLCHAERNAAATSASAAAAVVSAHHEHHHLSF